MFNLAPGHTEETRELKKKTKCPLFEFDLPINCRITDLNFSFGMTPRPYRSGLK